MELILEETLKFGITLLSILNPLGALPIYLGLTNRHSKKQIKAISNSCSLAVMVTIVLALAFGQKILGFFGISIPSFTIGGGFLIFTMAFSMIQAKHSNAKMNDEEIDHEIGDPREIGIVPLAIPLLSGPGVISSAIIYSKSMESTYHWLGAIGIVILTGLIVKLTLVYGRQIGNKMGSIGLNVMTRVMGIILLAASIEMVVAGIKEILPVLKG